MYSTFPMMGLPLNILDMLVACIIAFIGAELSLVRAVTIGRTYTNEWAVKVSGGIYRANEIASRYEFANRGQVRYGLRVCASCVTVFIAYVRWEH